MPNQTGWRAPRRSQVPPLELDDDVVSNGDSAAAGIQPNFQYVDDPIATRICELFDEMQDLEPEEDDFAEVEVRMRKKDDNSGFFKRRKQTVSGYFSEWTKWLRNGDSKPTAREG